MTRRFYSVDVGDGTWVYGLDIDGYETTVHVTGMLLRNGRIMKESHTVESQDFVRNVANNGVREASQAEKELMAHEAAEDQERDVIEWSEPDDLDEVMEPQLHD